MDYRDISKNKVHLIQERDEHKLTLRKRHIEQIVMKKRFTEIIPSSPLKEKEYTLDLKSLNLPPEYKTKEFNNLNELLDFIIILFKSEINDYICFGIILIKNIKNFNDADLLSQYDIPTYLLKFLNQNKDNKVVLNEIISTMINLTYISNNQIAIMLSSEKFLYCYNILLNKYNDDMIIKCNLIMLFGNLVSGDHHMQKIFFQSGLFNVIYPIANSKIRNEQSDISLWFIMCFIYNIINNYFFKDKIQLLLKCEELFIKNIIHENLTLNCLFGIENLSESENNDIIYNIISNERFMKFILSLQQKYKGNVNKIICNLASNDEDVILILIKKYNVLEYLSNCLEFNADNIQAEVVYTLCNFVVEKNQEILHSLLSKISLNKIFTFARDYNKCLVKNAIEFIVNLIIAGEKDIFDCLYNEGIVKLFIELIEKNSDNYIIDKTLDGVYCLLNKNRKKFKDDRFKIEFENKGGKELLEKVLLEQSLNKNKDKVQNIIDLIFSDANI